MGSKQNVAVITGASRDISAALVRAYQDRSYRVVATARSIEQSGDDDPLVVSGDIADRRRAERVIWLKARASHLALLRVSTLALAPAFLILGNVDQLTMRSASMGIPRAWPGRGVLCILRLLAKVVPEPLLGRTMAISSTLIFLGQFISPSYWDRLWPLTSAPPDISSWKASPFASSWFLSRSAPGPRAT